MGGIKYNVHPLFFVVGFYYALTGRIFVFLIYAFTAVLHETGHSVAAAKSGYELNKIILTPFGAVAQGNIEGLKFYDEFVIAAAGPLVNLAIGLLFVALWWIFPEIYAFTDVAAEANFSLALVNLIPAYPLDGGRILSALLALKIGGERAAKICKIIGIAFAAALFAGFIYTAFSLPNVSLLIFAVFVFVGAVSRDKENKYVKISSAMDKDKLRRGVPIKRQAVSKDITVKTLVKITDANAINEIDVYDGDALVKKLNHREIAKILATGDLYSKLEKYV